MAQPASVLASDPALQRASLAPLLHERIIATVNARAGVVVAANDRFCDLVGRPEEEVVGARLSEIWNASASAVDRMLDAARAGEYLEQVIEVIDTDERHHWLRLNCGPVEPAPGARAADGQLVLVTAYDITEDRRQVTELEGKYAAIGRAQSVIEFDLGGTILTANENLLARTGYGLSDLVGQHHRMLCEERYAESQ